MGQKQSSRSVKKNRNVSNPDEIERQITDEGEDNSREAASAPATCEYPSNSIMEWSQEIRKRDDVLENFVLFIPDEAMSSDKNKKSRRNETLIATVCENLPGPIQQWCDQEGYKKPYLSMVATRVEESLDPQPSTSSTVDEDEPSRPRLAVLCESPLMSTLQWHDSIADQQRSATVQDLISNLVNEFAYMAKKKIGGTVIVYCLRNDTSDWKLTQELIASFWKWNRPYKPGDLKRIFKSKGPEHDGAAILRLYDGKIYSVANQLPLKHITLQQPGSENTLAKRGTRHRSAFSFSHFTTAPIIVVSEEKGEISLFRQGQMTLNIEPRILEEKLFNAYEEPEYSCVAYNTFDDQAFAKSFSLNTKIPFDDWYYDCYMQNQLDYHKGTVYRPNGGPLAFTLDTADGQTVIQQYIRYNSEQDIILYDQGELRSIILSHGDKRLGGFFYTVSEDGRTLILRPPFLLRQLVHAEFAASFVKEILWKDLNPRCKRIELIVPTHLMWTFFDFFQALGEKLAVEYQIVLHSAYLFTRENSTEWSDITSLLVRWGNRRNVTIVYDLS